MRPKDLVMDLFGDYVRYTGGSIRLGQLTHLLELFGVEPATTRVTLSRMRKDGWVETERHGREMSYSATPRLLEVLDEGRARIFAPSRSPWAGQWTMVIYQIPESRRADREQLKKMLSWEGFGQLTPTTWVAPRDVRERMCAALDCDRDENVHVVLMSTGSLERDRRLARQCWDLEDLSRDYRLFVDECRQWAEGGAQGLAPEEALVARVRLVSAYRRFPFRDPQLPTALQPDDWPGDTAYELFVRAHQALAGAATEYVSAVLADSQRTGSPTPFK
ncbi:PaaX family transcriptional regulator [Kocuria dechangensis]|uniref:PaaX family transcriptional regulator n=1 Tax=Kocuria dechangensis TaxID=1176249 RepID=A0A917LSM6_9MICC|nr:PaaX family transcriptional regulator C-terminal domain-containing protein [Kocuria dechangensis]GGG54237.1 PaaX family transcriptional regulator [Kocuria dechangensis]